MANFHVHGSQYNIRISQGTIRLKTSRVEIQSWAVPLKSQFSCKKKSFVARTTTTHLELAIKKNSKLCLRVLLRNEIVFLVDEQSVKL